MLKKRIHLIVNQNGFVLALTLMCALVLTSVMISTMFVSTKGMKVSKNLKESVQTLNAADAAIKQAKTALSQWLITQQVGTGVIANFSSILTASASAGELVISGNSTDWGSLSLLGNTVSITVSDDEGSSDTDRIIKLTATATSPARQRVQIDAWLQAPSDTNTSGIPTLQAPGTLCSDSLARRQVLRIKEASFLDGHNYTLPAWTCTGDSCATSTSLVGSNNLPPSVMYNSSKQFVLLIDTSTYDGVPSTNQIISDSTYCDNLFEYANQVALLSDSLPNVNVIDGATVSSAELGTHANPVVSIFNGATVVSKRGVTRTQTTIDANSRGSGIMMLQYDTDMNNAALVYKDNYYYEGVAIVYGDERALFRLRSATMYGAVIVLTGSDDSSMQDRFALRHESVMKYSTAAIAQADLAMGTASAASVPVTSAADARNQVITVGWAEVYGGA